MRSAAWPQWPHALLDRSAPYPGCPLNHIVFMERTIGNGVRSQVD
jgi:hypothetical protein